MKVAEYIEGLVPYQPGKPIAETQREFGLETVFKLASNENPLGPSPLVQQALQRGLADIHIYPDAACYELSEAVGKHYKIAPNKLLFGNGSNELIDLVIRVFCRPGDQIITSQRAFIAYKICAQAAGVTTHELPLRADYTFDIPALTQYCRQLSTRDKIIFIPNPNNPTGTYVNQYEVLELLKVVGNREDILLVFDEAYSEFVAAQDFPNSFSLVEQYKNVLVLRTFSKVFGLAGLRLGFLYGDPEWLSYLHRVRNPFNVSSLAQLAGVAALADVAHLQKSQEIVWEGLQTFYEGLNHLGLFYLRSQGNFVLFDTGRNAQELFVKLIKQGVIMRPVASYGLPTFLRLSVGLADANQAALRALEDVLATS